MERPMARPVAYDPFSREVMSDPYPIYRQLRASYRAYRLPEYDAWALTRFEDIWQVLADRRRFSIVEGPVFARPRLLRHNDGPPAPPPLRPVPSFAMLDPPLHTELRRAMLGPFLPGAVAALEPTVRTLARERLDTLAGRDTFDVRHDYASFVSAGVAAHQLGFPVEDATRLAAIVNRYVRRDEGRAGVSDTGDAARGTLDGFMADLVTARRAAPHDRPVDALDGLLAFEAGESPLTDEEIAGQLVTLFVGGSETLPKVVAGATYELWRAPDQRRALVEDPSAVPAAFEEALRYDLPLQFVGRTLLVDAEVAGEPMRAGQRLVLLLICANRDEHEFVDPERFDASRRMERHLGLGHGVHVCIGAHVARLLGTVLIQELLGRYPGYEVDDTDLRREGSEFHVGWAEMPVAAR
jgi:cytochrome P450